MNARQTERKVNAIVNEILDEDEGNDFGATQAETCPEVCNILNDTPKEASRQCRCAVENSSRFSLRVMEAMRSLQRDVDHPSTSNVEEIVNYIRSHYRYDGDLYAQVRTALRQVCSQGFVMELLSNEYHLVGPIARSTKKNGCSLDCKGRAIDDASRRWESVHDQKNGLCGCVRSPKRFRSATISVDEQHGPSNEFLRTSTPDLTRNAKKARVEDRGVQRTDEKDDETTTEEDIDCTCDAEVVTRDTHSRIRPLGRSRVVNQRNRRRRNDAEEDEEERVEEDDDEDDAGERAEEENEDDARERAEEEGDDDAREKAEEEDDDDARERAEEEDDDDDARERAEEEDEDVEDSVYEELRAQVPRRRITARERELKRWIRRCREECERRRGR